MKKTYNINLNGQIFCIDDDACLKLQSYIDTLESHYLKEEDGREIMADIESRIAELLKEALGKGYKQVVTMEDIDQIIRIMGSPDVIIDEDTDKSTEPIKRKLYRDTDESVLGGVASGIAAYFDISVVWIRIAFVLLAFFYGVTILVYIILWIATPAAVTARQKMEMKGEKINVSNIEKNIRDTYDDLKKNSGIQKFFTGIENGAKTCFQKLNTILRKCLKIVFSVLSVVGLLAGTFLFILVFWCLLYPESVTNFSIYHILCSSISSELLLTLKIILLLTLNIPLLLIIYISARYLFQFNWNKIFLLTAIGCWFLAGFAGIIITIQQSLSYSDVTADADADVAMPLTDLGIDPDTDLADQYPFTKTTASDQNGVQRGSTWQCCPGLLVYRRDIAKDVFGTDDPAVIGEKVKDWDTLKQTAEELKAKGYFTFAS